MKKSFLTSLLILFCSFVTAQEDEAGQPASSLKHTSVTIGYCQAGGSYIGADLELLVTPRMGLQSGIGYLGYEAGINYHFRPLINSSFLSLKYWHQGIGDKFRQDAVGATLNFRARKLISTQLGLGFPMKKGPAMAIDYELPKVMLLYSIGIYFTPF